MAKKQPKKPHRTEVQHYVPQFYLRGFTNDTGRMFCYDKVSSKSHPTTTKAAAQEPNFYEIRPIPGLAVPLNAIERELGAVETAWAPMLADLIRSADGGGIKAQQVVDFAPFVIIQWMRTKTFRDVGYELMTRCGQKLTDTLAEVNTPNMAGKVKFRLDKEAMPGVHAEHLLDAPKVARMAGDLERHLWVIGINETVNLFYTSDHPMVRRGNQKVNGEPQIGPRDPGIEYAFPLDSRHILLILERTHFAEWKKYDNKAVRLTSEQVRDYNELQVLRSNQRVYCANDDFDLARAVCAAHPEVCDPQRPRAVVEMSPIIDMQSYLSFRVLE
jgi:hypothetical protein